MITPLPPVVERHAVSRFRAGRVVAACTLRDTARRRGSWTTTLLTGLLFAILVVGSGSISERLQERAENISFRVAVQGDRDGARQLLEKLSTEQLRIDVSGDASDEVTANRAAVGIGLPDDVDGHLARQDPVEVTIFYRAGNNVSREAYNTLLLRLQEIELSRLAAGTTVESPVGIDERQVRRDERVNRLQFARILSSLAAVLCLGVVSSAASVLGRSRERRAIEPLLLLPFSRTTIATATVAGTLPVAILQLLAAVGLLVVASALPLIGLGLSMTAIAETLVVGAVGVALLGALACSTGCLAGALGTGSDDAVSVGDFFSLPFVAVGVLLFLQPLFPSSVLTFALPIVGPALLLRDGAGGDLSLLNAFVTLVTTGLWCALLVTMTARRLDGDRTIARATR